MAQEGAMPQPVDAVAEERKQAHELAGRLLDEFSRVGTRGWVPINRFYTVGVLADALNHFGEIHPNIVIRVVPFRMGVPCLKISFI